MACCELKDELFILMEKAVKDGYSHFIFGAALGVDTYVGELLIILKHLYSHIVIEAAVPFEGQSDMWNQKDRERYENILSKCDIKTIVSKTYTSTCMQKRNKYMVDKSSLVIAVWNGSNSGTGNTVLYAKSKNKEVKILLV